MTRFSSPPCINFTQTPPMHTALPVELCHAVLDNVAVDRASLLGASLVSRAWREYLFLPLFKSITIFVERGPWIDPSCLHSRALLSIAPHVASLRISSLTYPRTHLGDNDDDPRIRLIQSVLSLLTNLSRLEIEHIELWDVYQALSFIQAAGCHLVHVELQNVSLFKSVSRTRTWKLSPTLTSLSLNGCGFWSLQFLSYIPIVASLKRLQLTHDIATAEFNGNFLRWLMITTFLALPQCIVTDFEVDDFALSLRADPLAFTVFPEALLPNRSLERLTLRTSTCDGAEAALALLEASRVSALTHVNLKFDLQGCCAELSTTPITVDNPASMLPQSYPRLQQVDLIVRDSANVLAGLNERSWFLKGCAARRMFKMTMLETNG
jgi:hypothetical protein